MKLGAFPPGAAFLPALARHWLAQPGAVADGLIILPNRRAARALAGAFLQASDGRALLLPRIIALGALDETALSLAGGLDLPPAIAPLRRQAMLARLILRLQGANGAPRKLHHAFALAGDLAALLDEADYAGIDLAQNLPELVAADLASHWQITLKFLEIITHAWPKILAGEGRMNPAARQVALIEAQNQAWANSKPLTKIWLVARQADPATGRLARTIAGLPNGLLLLPGYDPALSEPQSQAAWEALDDSHAQSGIARLLGAIGARREEILPLDAPSAVPASRAALLSRALLPAACLAAWQKDVGLETHGLFVLAARDEQEDATAIAMILREALQTPGVTTALITPDRALGLRVTAALARFGITANDSAGEALADSPPAILLRLLARAAAAAFAPVPLLALLKHPLTAAGEPPEICRAHARALEMAALRGARPERGFAGIRFRLEAAQKTGAELNFLARLEQRLAPLAGLAEAVNPAAALQALIETGEALAATEQKSGAAVLWHGEAGSALSELLLEALAALPDLPDIHPGDLPFLLDALLANHVIRRPRAKDGHPRIAIWGVQEAMLQTVDVAVLAGLNEGVWPPAAEPGPWLSRAMRKAAGLASPEENIGVAAHDFFALAASCPTVIFAAPRRRERAPAVPARWLTRLEAMLRQSLPRHDAAAWAAQLDTHADRNIWAKPRPRPPAQLRPTKLSISDIATLIADPYAIYARKILRIRKLEGLDEESDQRLFGNIVHQGLAAFLTLERDLSAPDAAAQLAVALEAAMRAARPRAALQHWWEARLERIAGWVVEVEAARRRDNPTIALRLEADGELPVPGGFLLHGRADRIERLADGGIAILDYKTGPPPGASDVRDGTAPQLPLEAVMAEAGAFGPDFAAPVTELAFWQLSGRHNRGDEKPLFSKPGELAGVIAAAALSLPELFAHFADPQTPYLAKPHPDRSTYEDIYAGISRSGEWGGAGGDDDAA